MIDERELAEKEADATEERDAALVIGHICDFNSEMDPETRRRIAFHEETARIAREEYDRENGIRKRGAPKRRERYRGTPPGGTPRLTEFSLSMARTVATIDGTVERWTGKVWQRI